MKVLLIDVNCKNSSTGKIVYDLYTNLNKHGHTAAICYGRGPLVEGTWIYRFSNNIESYLHALLTRITGLTGIYSPFATLKLIKFIKKFKPDVVHIHELHAYFVNIAPLINYLKKENIKTIWTFHCEFMYTGKCGYAYECEKWKVECYSCPQVKEYPKSLFFDFTRKMFNDKKELLMEFNNLTIVTPSKWLAERVRQSFLKEKDIIVIHNGIDTKSIFYPRNFEHIKLKHNLTDEKLVLAVAPNLMDDRKGGKWVLKLAKRFQGEKVKFILIGVEDLTQEFNDNVIALGRTTNQVELAEYYSIADVFIICSEKETFSLTCAEAICCGTHICGFKSGAPETIFTEKYASFVTYGDLNTLEIEIRNSLQNNLNRDNCRLYGEKHFSLDAMYKEYLKLYSSNIKEKEKK